jgi:Arc/MetJ family transcription regulator
MRTNIEIDDKLMADAQRATGTHTKKATVEEALRTVVRLSDQARLRELRGTIVWEGDLDAMRRER